MGRGPQAPSLLLLLVPAAAMVGAGGCRTRTVEPEVVVARPRIVACSDPQPIVIKVEPPVTWVEHGDFNGDGHADLVGASKGISIVFGNGDGTFSDATETLDRTTETLAAVADVDGNGADDVMMARANRQLEVLKGLPRVNQPKSSRIVDGYLPDATALAVGDLDGDRVPDAVLLDADVQGSAIRLLFGRDGVDFSPPARFSFPLTQGFVRLVDLDDDGRADVVAPCGAEVRVNPFIRRSPGGSVSSGPDLVAVTLPRAASALAFGDFNEDGLLDLAATAPVRGEDNVFVALRTGAAFFDAPRSMRAGFDPHNLVVVDWNLDGHLDLAVANSGTDHTVTFLYGLGDGTFSEPQVCQAVTFDSNGGPNWVTSADLDEDGRPDLAFAYMNGLTVVFNR